MGRVTFGPLSDRMRKKLGGSLIFFGGRPGRPTQKAAPSSETEKSDDESKSSPGTSSPVDRKPS
jgi:hypothetical protein